MSAIIQHLKSELMSQIRDKSQLLMNYLFPLSFFLIISAIMPRVYPDFHKGLIISMISFSIMVTSLLGLSTAITTSREKGIYRSYRIYGVPRIAVVIVPSIASMLHISIVCSAIGLIGLFAFAALPIANLIWFLAIFILGMVSFISLGLVIGVSSPNSRVSVLLGQLVFIPAMLIGGIIMPTSILGSELERVSRILPSTHLMNAFRALSMNQAPSLEPTLSIIVMAMSTLLGLFLAIVLFTWDNKNRTRTKHLLGFLVLSPYVISIAF